MRIIRLITLFVSLIIAGLLVSCANPQKLYSGSPQGSGNEPDSFKENDDEWKSKVNSELLEVMLTKTDNDLIPVYIWLKDIDHDVIDEAMINEKELSDDYIIAWLKASKREHSNYNNQFIENYVNMDRTIIDVGEYVPRIIVEATKQEIVFYSSLDEVIGLSYYCDFEQINN